jgi:hypothetical protein
MVVWIQVCTKVARRQYFQYTLYSESKLNNGTSNRLLFIKIEDIP